MTPRDATTHPTIRFVPIPFDALEALLAGDLGRASAITGVPLPEYFLTQDRVWRVFHDQIQRDPASAPWLVRAVVADPAGIVVGHAGFHGPPNREARVEIGYTVLPEHRRRGYGHATVTALLREAAASPAARTVRARVSSDNVASLALARAHGFRQVGEQRGTSGGLDLVFERPVEGAA